jgi:RNase H-fold protein (predicted Holliday junction resolvase)
MLPSGLGHRRARVADLELRAAGLPSEARIESRDAVAAQLILQSWLDEKSDALRDLA